MKQLAKRNIGIERIRPNQDNPRMIMGDLTELTESIRENGILQDLTVVPMDDDYRVVIGHRRLEAAKLAGLEDVPCNVVEMTEEEQIKTMLMENMQREDLTPAEQAQGFQVMLDIGMTKTEISKETGFSRATVNHRLELLKLDQDVLKEKGDQITMENLISLEKVDSKETRNKLLEEYGGTGRFYEAVHSAVREENVERQRSEVKKLLEAAGHEVEIKSDYALGDMPYAGSVFLSGEDDLDIRGQVEERILDGLEEGEKLYIEKPSYQTNTIWIHREHTTTVNQDKDQGEDNSDIEEELSEEKKAEQLWEEKCKEAAEKINEAEVTAYTKRREFVKKHIEEEIPVIQTAALKFMENFEILASSTYVEPEDIAKLLIQNYKDCMNDWTDDVDEFKDQHGGKSIFEFRKTMIAKAHSGYYTLAKSVSFDAKLTKGLQETAWQLCAFRGDKRLEETYKLLKAHDYSMEPWEKQLLNGTYPAYIDPDDAPEGMR